MGCIRVIDFICLLQVSKFTSWIRPSGSKVVILYSKFSVLFPDVGLAFLIVGGLYMSSSVIAGFVSKTIMLPFVSAWANNSDS